MQLVVVRAAFRWLWTKAGGKVVLFERDALEQLCELAAPKVLALGSSGSCP